MNVSTMPVTGDRLSALGLGCMRLPTTPQGGIDYPTAQAMVDAAIAGGVNYFDTAYIYHEQKSEGFLGQALAAYPRESYYLSDKLPMWMVKQPEDVHTLFATQLERCRTGYFDYYLMHSMNAASFEKANRFGIYDLLAEKKRQGVIRNLGFSFHDKAPVLEAMLSRHHWDFVLLQINYLDWYLYDAKELYDTAARHGVPIFVMEPVRGGALAELPPELDKLLRAVGATPASVALRFAAQLEQVKVVLSGMSSPRQLAENIGTFSGPGLALNPAESRALEQVVTAMGKIETVPCTGCRYCMDCPFGVDIPEMFEIYNTYKLVGGLTAAHRKYNELTDAANRASACTACGACVPVCPQGIDIPVRLAEVDRVFARPGA